ncbi:uncharacterized protein LOC143555343 [Bidens hawaiensis]|uniref:uncharacterized protein LOC143555343 n=1 Tax=Bidens hawaiensis TaxID=980011 RepID=UPI004049598D
MDFRYTRPPPPPPPPPPESQQPPAPGTWHTGQFPYQSPSPPTSHWAPHSDHHHRPPPPPMMPYHSNNYSVPHRPHMPPPLPHYSNVNQGWSNQSLSLQGWDYSAHNRNEDDWAARAKAWAASKAVTDGQHQHQHSQSAPANPPEETNYQNQYPQNSDYQQHPLPPSSYQQYPSSFALPPRPPANHLQEPSSFSSGYAPDGHYSYPARDGNLRDPVAVYPHQETAPTIVSAHQLEVPSSYSSVAGKEEPSDMNRNFYQPPHMAYASAPQHQVQPSISPNERSIPVEQPHYSYNNSSAESASDLSNQPLDFVSRYGHDPGPFGQSGVPGTPYSMPPVHTTIQQTDPSLGVSSPASLHPTPFGRISSFQPTMPSANTTFPLGTSNAFHGDTYGTPAFPERPKKASVPNWLREEIIKKKAVIGSSAPGVSRQDPESNEDEVMDHKGDLVGGKNRDSARSTEEEDDDEDYVKAARTVAVNQEIKRILTEVLLKVTDELFDEIATKVLEEDDLNVEVERKADNAPAVITPKPTAKVIIPANTKGADVDDANWKSTSSSPGDLLGLGSYASDDDDDEEKDVKNPSVPSSNSSKPPVHLSENGSSQVDDVDVHGKKLLEENDSHKVGPNGATESHIDKSIGEKVKPDSSDFSKSKPSVIESGLEAKNSLQYDSRNGPDKSDKDKKRNKADEDSRTHDERNTKRAKQEDRNGSEEKIEDHNSEKRVGKTEVKNDKEERERDRRSHDKEDREKDKRSRDKEDKEEREKDRRSRDKEDRERDRRPRDKEDRERDRRSRDKEDSRKRDKEKDDKNERSKHKPDGDSSRHKRRHSPSPGGRGRSSKDNLSVSHARGSSDSSSDDSRRKVRSRRRDLSPSPVRSRRQVSRSPSKRSHRRQSNYSSLETTRERRRSRSRSRSRTRR